MFKLQTNSNHLRSWLLAGAAVAVASGTALAQSSDQSIETVVVTGSLIQRAAGDMPTPTVVLSPDIIAKTGQANISKVLNQLPQVQNAAGLGDLSPVNSNFLTSGFGVSNVDLRLLGSSRTLVLVNGRRQVTGSPTGSSVDLNTIPTALISRVEVITGGASAVYGSDAVAGVVNIMLKDDFQGMAGSLQTGISSRGDAADTVGTLTLGGNFADGRGNVTVSLTYDHSGAVMSKNRDITSTDSTHNPGLFPYIGTYGLPAFGVGSAYSSYGVGGRFRLAAPNALGQVLATGGSYNPNGTTFDTAVDGFDRSPNRYIQVPVSRKVIAETGHYDITDSLRFFVETTYAQTHASQQLEPYPGSSEDGLSAPTSANGTGILIPRTNPFIPTVLASKLAAAPNDPGLFFYRRFIDLGDRTGTVDRNMSKIVFGFDGEIPYRDWKWNSYYEWGRTEESQFNGGYYDKIKMQQALDSHIPTSTELAAGITAPAGGGGAVCNDAIARAAGCVPINLFGAGAITSQAANYVGSLVTIQDHADEQVGSFTANGSVFDLPAGAVKLAVGGEYRRESADFVPDAASQAGTVAGNAQPRTSGAFDVKEIFAEGLVPVLKDLPFAQYVEINGAVRHANYSTAGEATSWRFGGIWQPFDDLRIRATESSATRAPNISELFSPAAQTFPGLGTTADPCISRSNANSTIAANIAANCATARAALSAPYVGEPTWPTYSGSTGQAAAQGIGGYQMGNPNLKPETAHTFTAGAVYTPSWLSSFQATVDFYDIRLAHIIGGLSAVDTLNACYQASPSQYATNVFCQQIVRQHDSVLGPIIKQINFPTFNLGSVKTSGVDTALTYAFEMADLDQTLENAGAWNLTLDVTYLNTYNTDPGVAGTSVIVGSGTVGLEHWRGLFRSTYNLDKLSVMTTLRYVGAAYVDKTLPLDLEGNHIGSTWYLDLNVSYDLSKSVQLYAGANNLFDNRPPEVFQGAGYDDTGTGTAADVYDPIGLYLYTGVSFKL